MSTSNPRTDCGNCGIPEAEPGVSCSPKTGIAAEIRNHSRKELPLMRPTIPPASPKQTAMIT